MSNNMRVVIFLAAIGFAAAIPKPGLQFRNLFKPATGPRKVLKPRIIGGSEAVPHSRPFQAFMEIHAIWGGGWCSGELISNNYVMSAGHCGLEATGALITLGAHNFADIFDPAQLVVNSTNVTLHPDYDDENILNDISVFRLDQPVEFNEFIQPVPLPSRDEVGNTFVGENGTVSGWGITESGEDGGVSSVLKVLDSPVVPNSQCEEESGWEIPGSQICISGSEGTGTCNGDSGGPLTVKIDGVDTVVGIVSYGVLHCEFGYPSVFTRVTEFLDFIAANTDAVVN